MLAASYTSSVNGSDINADRISQASSSDLGEQSTQHPLSSSEWDDKDGCLTEDEDVETETEHPVKSSLRLLQILHLLKHLRFNIN